jgi:hypothetical protein
LIRISTSSLNRGWARASTVYALMVPGFSSILEAGANWYGTFHANFVESASL